MKENENRIACKSRLVLNMHRSKYKAAYCGEGGEKISLEICENYKKPAYKVSNDRLLMLDKMFQAIHEFVKLKKISPGSKEIILEKMGENVYMKIKYKESMYTFQEKLIDQESPEFLIEQGDKVICTLDKKSNCIETFEFPPGNLVNDPIMTIFLQMYL